MGSETEIVAIVDRDNRIIDALPRKEMRRQGLIHRATYVVVVNQQQELFVQKRTQSKDIYPGHYDIAAGGVVLAGESYPESARRELAEELGVRNTPLTELFPFYFEDQRNRVWGMAFLCTHEGPFLLQAEEVESGTFLSLQQVRDLAATAPFTPDGLLLLDCLCRHDFPVF